MISSTQETGIKAKYEALKPELDERARRVGGHQARSLDMGELRRSLGLQASQKARFGWANRS